MRKSAEAVRPTYPVSTLYVTWKMSATSGILIQTAWFFPAWYKFMEKDMISNNIVIVSAVRTPFDKFGGAMKSIPSYQLAAQVMSDCVEKINFKKDEKLFIFFYTVVS